MHLEVPGMKGHTVPNGSHSTNAPLGRHFHGLFTLHGCSIVGKKAKIENGVKTGAFPHYGPLYLDMLYQAPPVVAEQQQGDTRTVAIPRRIAEAALVDDYKESLRGMSDEDIAKLFEEEILIKRSQVSSAQQVLKEFPSSDVLDDSPVKEERLNSSPSTSLSIENTDETALLLQGGEDVDDNSMAPQYTNAVLNTLFEKGLRGIQGRAKDLAVPIMGSGALVLGVALMYTLISTLSGGKGDLRSEPEEAPPEQGQPGYDPSTDPYTMYNTTAGTGEVIWQRKEEERNDVREKDIDEDPWRIPMSDANSEQEDPPVRQTKDVQVSVGKRMQIENKRPPPLDQILDNAESISQLKRGHSSVPNGDPSRPKA